MADLDRFRRSLAALPALTAEDAEQMVIQLQRAAREADRAAAQGQTEAAR